MEVTFYIYIFSTIGRVGVDIEAMRSQDMRGIFVCLVWKAGLPNDNSVIYDQKTVIEYALKWPIPIHNFYLKLWQFPRQLDTDSLISKHFIDFENIKKYIPKNLLQNPNYKKTFSYFNSH